MQPVLGFFQQVGWPEILIVLAVLLLLFGTRLPSLARSMGLSVGEFKKGLKDGHENSGATEQPATPPAPTEKK